MRALVLEQSIIITLAIMILPEKSPPRKLTDWCAYIHTVHIYRSVSIFGSARRNGSVFITGKLERLHTSGSTF